MSVLTGNSVAPPKYDIFSVAMSKLVTDAAFGAKMFAGDKVVRAHTVDANSESAFDICVREFGEPRIDLAFIDTTHDFWPTLQSVMLYGGVMECPLIVIDDITLNERMMRLWGLLRLRFGGENTIDAAQVNPEIRTGGDGTNPGFGVVRIPRRIPLRTEE